MKMRGGGRRADYGWHTIKGQIVWNNFLKVVVILAIATFIQACEPSHVPIRYVSEWVIKPSQADSMFFALSMDTLRAGFGEVEDCPPNPFCPPPGHCFNVLTNKQRVKVEFSATYDSASHYFPVLDTVLDRGHYQLEILRPALRNGVYWFRRTIGEATVIRKYLSNR